MMNSSQPSGSTATPTSPRGSVGRPPLVQRHSSQSSTARLSHVASPGSAGEHHPLRHAVGGRQRQTKFALPRNHSSGRNLAKMGRQNQQQQQQQQQADDGRRSVRQRGHEGDTEIRLPGSLDERPLIRRNMTASHLPRNSSHAKLKKNLSHGQLTRLHGGGGGGGRSSHNLQGMTGQKAPPSPGLKGKSKRPKSAEIIPVEKELHEREVEVKQEREEEGSKKVGFAVGSPGDTTEGDETPPVASSGLQEDDWTDQSASASPYSTRQNTANNSRRPSVVTDKLVDKSVASGSQHMTSINERAQPQESESDDTSKQQKSELVDASEQHISESDGTSEQSMQDSDEDQDVSPRSTMSVKKAEGHQPPGLAAIPPPQIRSPLHAAKDHPNPTTRRLVSNQLPAPAQLSNVSALDDGHSTRGTSPAPSMRSVQSTVAEGTAADQDSGELVSRFIPSTSHPSLGSGLNTGAMNTPAQGSFHTPEEDSTLEQRARSAPFQIGPASPGSIISGSSGAATPALGRSRIELRMMHDKALADREAAAGRKPLVPHHIYDRRNETLKSYLNLASLGGDATGSMPPSSAMLSLGPEIFQGRFKGINTELKVVQKFRDPIAEAVARLRGCKGTKMAQQRSPQKANAAAAALKTSKSAVSLPASRRMDGSKLSTSASPPKSEMATSASPRKPTGSTGVAVKPARRGVSFAGAPPPSSSPQMREREIERAEDEGGPDAIAQALWNMTSV